jgi:hypothetical protein
MKSVAHNAVNKLVRRETGDGAADALRMELLAGIAFRDTPRARPCGLFVGILPPKVPENNFRPATPWVVSRLPSPVSRLPLTEL